MIYLGRFGFTRSRMGWFVETRWFFIRFYPPTLPQWSGFWKGWRGKGKI